MKEKKKNRKLLFQIGVVLIPMFLGLMAGILWVIYDSSVDGYLEAQNTHMEIFLNQVYTETLYYQHHPPESSLLPHHSPKSNIIKSSQLL